MWQGRELRVCLVGSGELEMHQADSTGICLAGRVLHAPLRSKAAFLSETFSGSVD